MFSEPQFDAMSDYTPKGVWTGTVCVAINIAPLTGRPLILHSCSSISFDCISSTPRQLGLPASRTV